MLSLNLKDGEYLTIGEDIVIQVFTNSTIRVAVQAPREMTVLRGAVLERNGKGRPDCVYDPKSIKRIKAAPKTTPNQSPLDLSKYYSNEKRKNGISTAK